MNGLPFLKMHGAGNDFVILDGRRAAIALTPSQAAHIADRRRGVGCDQLILIGESETGMADAALTFFNPDGSESAACGNGTRCVADILMAETGESELTLETGSGLLDCERNGTGITVDMGPARIKWQEIPLAQDHETLHLGIGEGVLNDPVAVNMGNPHAVFFVDDVAQVPIETLGPKLEHHTLFPERANIGVAQVRARDNIRLRVWERGAGLTLACGSGACAALVAAVRRGLTDRKAEVEVDGGLLTIEWSEADGHVLMTGPTAHVFAGTLDESMDGALDGRADGV